MISTRYNKVQIQPTNLDFVVEPLQSQCLGLPRAERHGVRFGDNQLSHRIRKDPHEHDFHQGRQFVEQAMTHFLGDKVTLQGGQLAIHSDVHFAI